MSRTLASRARREPASAAARRRFRSAVSTTPSSRSDPRLCSVGDDASFPARGSRGGVMRPLSRRRNEQATSRPVPASHAAWGPSPGRLVLDPSHQPAQSPQRDHWLICPSTEGERGTSATPRWIAARTGLASGAAEQSSDCRSPLPAGVRPSGRTPNHGPAQLRSSRCSRCADLGVDDEMIPVLTMGRPSRSCSSGIRILHRLPRGTLASVKFTWKDVLARSSRSVRG